MMHQSSTEWTLNHCWILQTCPQRPQRMRGYLIQHLKVSMMESGMTTEPKMSLRVRLMGLGMTTEPMVSLRVCLSVPYPWKNSDRAIDGLAQTIPISRCTTRERTSESSLGITVLSQGQALLESIHLIIGIKNSTS